MKSLICSPKISPQVFLFASLLLTLFYATKSDSLWIDEGDTAVYAIQPNFASWLLHLSTDGNADCQMPLTMLVAWVAAQVAGSSEVILRLPNFFWGAIALFAFAWVGSNLAGNPGVGKTGRKEANQDVYCIGWLPLFLAIQPFYVFYLGEARPYAAQIAVGSILVACLISFETTRGVGRAWIWLLSLGTLLGFATTILAPISIFPVYLSLVILAWIYRARISFLSLWPILISWTLCIPLAYYYLQTVLRGAEGTKIWDIGLKNLAYIAYEVLGLVGLGPAIREIREAAREGGLLSLFSASPLLFWGLGIILIVYMGIFISRGFLRTKDRRLPSLIYLPLGIFLVAGFLFALVAFILGKAFWARHLSMAFPFLIIGLAVLIHEFITIKSPLHSLRLYAVGALALTLLVSSLTLRISERHGNDDYRSAAQLAKSALKDGKRVWWFASWHCAAYYQLPVVSALTSTDPNLEVLHGPSHLSEQFPDLIIYSKPDIYDSYGVGKGEIERNGLMPTTKLRGFLVYEKSGLKSQ